jgi:hypothetical protein
MQDHVVAVRNDEAGFILQGWQQTLNPR